MQRITSSHSYPLYNVAATRDMEQRAATNLPPHTLMQRAGLAAARLTLALAPHARHIWIACGPGNNGGDGFEAALHLHQWGKQVSVSWSDPSAGRSALPPDAQASHDRAIAAGVNIGAEAPEDFDFCIDALLGIGSSAREPEGVIAQWLQRMQASDKPRLCIDVPSGLNADTGSTPGTQAGAQIFTLSLLTLKPGLFTAQGRDCAGEVWFDDLGTSSASPSDTAATAWLQGQDSIAPSPRQLALHASHKGSFGDVAVIGGESSTDSHMAGAALLAAGAALHAGAGRVYVALLAADGQQAMTVDATQPELMFRSPDALDLKNLSVVCGCGGGDAVRAVLPRVLSTAPCLVLDADALNAIAADSGLQTLLKARQARGWQTVLTPHPLEGARLAGKSTADVQADRLAGAAQLAETFGAVIVLKGSGTVIAGPGQTSRINSSGNALLATAGTGDVLAGMVGAQLASGINAFEAACNAVFRHGRIAEQWLLAHPGKGLVASEVMRRAVWDG
ncbi:MAG: NAD(P)H-hydrate dehydratase [Pseudomonadota bacterium]